MPQGRLPKHSVDPVLKQMPTQIQRAQRTRTIANRRSTMIRIAAALVILSAVLTVRGPVWSAEPEPPARVTSVNQLPTIRPGQSGRYPVFVAPPVQPATRIVGVLRGRQIKAIQSPAHVSGMGKYMATGPRGDIWYVESREDKAVRIDPISLELVQYYLPKGAAPYSIAIDSRGTAWMTGHGIEMLLE